MKGNSKVFLRGDGDSKIGLGHIHRLLAIGQYLKNHFDCTFVIKNPLPGIENRLRLVGEVVRIDEGEVADEPKKINKLVSAGDIVVLDGYFFDTAYQRALKEHGCCVICIDDLASFHFVADAVINPSGGITNSVYSAEPYTKIFTGPMYAPVKEIFLSAARNRPDRSFTGSVAFICMGGADPLNVTAQVVQRVIELNVDRINVVVGEAYRHYDSLDALTQSARQDIKIHVNAEAETLVELMQASTFAVCSASGISYEYLCVGGELYIQKTADNQQLLYQYLIDSKVAFDMGDVFVSRQNVSDAIDRQREIFDGGNDRRITKLFQRLEFAQNVAVRRANWGDLNLLFEWTNEPELRQASFSSNPITFANHSEWFRKKLEDQSCHIFVFEFKKIPFALVRFDVVTDATISYSIDKQFRGRGWGKLVLEKAISLVSELRPKKIIGFVKKNNRNSIRVFDSLGFKQLNTDLFPESYKFELNTYE